MRLALYYPWLYLPGGPERTAVEILTRSRHQWTAFTNRYEPDVTFPQLQAMDVRELPLRVSVKRTFLHVGAAAWRIALQRLPLEGYDALIVFCEGLGDLALLRNSSVPTVCLCFTPLRAAFDSHYQQHYLCRNGGRFWRGPILRAAAASFRMLDRLLWRKYAAVFAISSEVRRRIVAGGLYPEKSVRLLYPGVDTRRLVPTGGRSKDFLVPGRIMWTKNLGLAIDAFRLLLARRPDLSDFTLTVAGHVDRKSQAYFDQLRILAAGCPQIQFRTSLSDPAFFGLCDSAYAIVYPPFNEDWGLIPLETMSLRKPVIAVNRGGPGETVVDGETGFLVEPEPAEFAQAMETLADDPDLVNRMGERARARAANFDWSSFCQQLDDALDQLCRSKAAPAGAPLFSARGSG